jgi:hypothetical protein
MKKVLFFVALLLLAFKPVTGENWSFFNTLEIIRAFVLDDQGNWYVGVDGGVRVYVNGSTDNTQFFNLGVSVTALTLTNNEDSVLVGSDQGIFKTDRNFTTKRWLSFQKQPLAPRKVMEVNGSYWALLKPITWETDGRVFFLPAGAKEWQLVFNSAAQDMVADKDGFVWVTCGYLYKVNAQTGQKAYIPITYLDWSQTLQTAEQFYPVTIDSAGEFIYTQGSGGIYKISAQQPENYRWLNKSLYTIQQIRVLGQTLWGVGASEEGRTESGLTKIRCQIGSLNTDEANPAADTIYYRTYFSSKFKNLGANTAGFAWREGFFTIAIYPDIIASFGPVGLNNSSLEITSSENTITTTTINWAANVPDFQEYRLYYSADQGAFQPCPNLEQGPDYGKPLVITDPSVASFTFDYFNPVKDSTIILKIVALSTDGNVVSAEQSFIIPRTVGYDTDGGEAWFPGYGCFTATDFLGNLTYLKRSLLKSMIFSGDSDSSVTVEIRKKDNPTEPYVQVTADLIRQSDSYLKWREVKIEPAIELAAGEYYIGFNGTSQIVVDQTTTSTGHSYVTAEGWPMTPMPAPQYDFLLRLEVVDLSSVEELGFNPVPQDFALEQNFPNPFNPQTTISYSLAKPGNIKLIIYNILGREVETLINEQQLPGAYYLRWVADENLPAGIYFCRLQADNFVQTKKMTLMK